MTALLVLVCVALVLLAVMLVGVWGNTVQLHRLLGLAEQRAAQEDTWDDEPVAVDPDRPAAVRHYRGGLPDLTCVCHGEPVAPDTDVMMIPVADSAEIKVYCEREVASLRQLRGER